MQVRKFAEFSKYAEEFPPRLTTTYISIPFVLTAIVTVNQNDSLLHWDIPKFINYLEGYY